MFIDTIPVRSYKTQLKNLKYIDCKSKLSIIAKIKESTICDAC